MTETKPLDEIIQRLDTLSLEQLLEARTKIDTLIQSKYCLNGSLKEVIKLVNCWMADESGYDEETYPKIEAALNQNWLSL
ncbi:MAG: hypothetical protein RLP02_07875 [Coleofasciculus sp. C2-GNP5-27]